MSCHCNHSTPSQGVSLTQTATYFPGYESIRSVCSQYNPQESIIATARTGTLPGLDGVHLGDTRAHVIATLGNPRKTLRWRWPDEEAESLFYFNPKTIRETSSSIKLSRSGNVIELTNIYNWFPVTGGTRGILPSHHEYYLDGKLLELIDYGPPVPNDPLGDYIVAELRYSP
jgi:hypothetical protein